MHQHSSVHLSYPTPSIDPHTSISNPHISILTTITYIFRRSVLLPSSQALQRGERWCTPPISIYPYFCRFSGPDTPPFPFNVRCSSSRQLSSSASDFGLSILDTTLLGRIRITFPVCYISCIMCTCFWTYGTPYILLPTPAPFPFPFPLLFRSFLPPIGIIEMVFSASFRCEKQKSILVRRFFLGSLCYSGGDQMVVLFLTPPGSDKTYFHLHLSGPPFCSAHEFVPL